jgi:predicted transglutaminase-like cysteine proteinase
MGKNRSLVWIVILATSCVGRAFAGSDAPQWMHALVSVPVPAHDEKTDAVKLYSEINVSVQSEDKIKRTVRVAYKILRPSGRQYGEVFVNFNSHEKISNLRGWCIPAQGKDFEAKEKEGAEVSLPKIEGSELVSDVKAKFITIPAADPGNIVGYEYEAEEHPLVLQDMWEFQGEVPSRESHYSLQLPAGWGHKSTWLHYPEVKPAESGSQLQWAVSDLKAIRPEEDMPPIQGLAGLMVVSFFPQGGSSSKSFTNWQQMGQWYVDLTNGRSDASPEVKQKVAALTASSPTQLAKMRAIAQFVQHDIRYVAIELGIGGWQPHYAAEVFTHRYGDCKDKATLMRSMLREIGIESYHVPINTERGSITPDVPAYQGFDHVILAIKLPDGVVDNSLTATLQHPKLGRLLFFDPTNELTPFGQIGGYLQDNYGLLVFSDRGELVKLPHQPAAMNGITRTAKLALEGNGSLKGDVTEYRVGDRAWSQRWAIRTVTNDLDRIKPIENLLAGSLSSYQITKATLINADLTDLPFGYKYSFQSDNYAKNAGNLILVRPRVMGSKAAAILETKEPRIFPIEFEGPVRDTDLFEIVLPQGYEIDDIPPAVDADFSFASYHAKTEVKGNVIAYTRTFEVKELSVPASKADDLKKFYRIISSDERNTAALKPSAK